MEHRPLIDLGLLLPVLRRLVHDALRRLGGHLFIAVEAAARLGWDRWIGERGAFVGMTGFGASAPAPDLYRHFDITPEVVAANVLLNQPAAIRKD